MALSGKRPMGPSSKLPADHQMYQVPLCELVSSSATVRLSSIGALVGRGGWLGLAACEDLPPVVAAGPLESGVVFPCSLLCDLGGAGLLPAKW